MSVRLLCAGSRYVVLLLLLSGCTTVPSGKVRTQTAMDLAESKNWSATSIATEYFDLLACTPKNKPDHTQLLTIYIEGDGLSWNSGSRISADPTPISPVGLMLALRHPESSVAYLARPCQYGQKRNCSNHYWTDTRFSREVVAASDQAIDVLKELYQADRLQLVGFSGGGAVAALVAAQRDDVARLVTVAGNLDHRIWTDLHRVSPLTGSLNPPDFWQQLVNIPQIHFVGSRDDIVPKSITESFIQRFPRGHVPVVQSVEDMEHTCCWVDIWSDLISQ